MRAPPSPPRKSGGRPSRSDPRGNDVAGRTLPDPGAEYRRCRSCGRPVVPAGDQCKRRDCPGYVELWMGDQYVRLLTNLLAYGREAGDGRAVMLTLTPPGAIWLPWDLEHCAHRGPHSHSGAVGCRTEPAAARRFNDGAMARWSRLWRATYAHAYRRHGSGALRLLGYACEPQRRGALHFHPVLGVGTPRQWAAARTAFAFLRANSERFGWGKLHDTWEVREAGQAAVYAAGYVAGGRKSSLSVREGVLNGSAPKRAVYVARSLTSKTGVTMRVLRFRRYLWRLWGVDVSLGDAAAVLRLRVAFPGCVLSPTECDSRPPPRPAWEAPWRRVAREQPARLPIPGYGDSLLPLSMPARYA